jgi:hypothetical protein
MDINEVTLNILNPFKNKKKFEEYFLHEMVTKNQSRIKTCLVILLVEKFVNIASNILARDEETSSWATNVMEIIISFALCLILIFYRTSVSKANPFMSKYLLSWLFLVNYLSRTVELLIFSLTSPDDHLK